MWMNKRWWSRNTGVPPGVRRLAPKSSWIKPWFPPSPCCRFQWRDLLCHQLVNLVEMYAVKVF